MIFPAHCFCLWQGDGTILVTGNHLEAIKFKGDNAWSFATFGKRNKINSLANFTIRHRVFWPPFLLLACSAAYSFWSPETFLIAVTSANNWILRYFGWLFSGSVFAMVLLCGWIYVSPLSRMVIGGADAQPMLTRRRWFSIILCTTIAIGILFWATAEPLYHLHQPPKQLGLEPGSPAAGRFALSTVFLHWTITPYAIYTLLALMFSLAFYQFKQPFSLASMLYPLMKGRIQAAAHWVDAISLYSLVAGMAASLGAGVLTLRGGLNALWQLESGNGALLVLTFLIIGTAVLSAVSGLMRGIRTLSNINLWAFIVLAVFVFLSGPTLGLLKNGALGFGEFITDFVPANLGLNREPEWTASWTTFYWANWLAWAPVTSAFLGRLAVGYTIRDFINYNLLLPALFSAIWMLVFSGSALHFDAQAGLFPVLQNHGPEGVIYALLKQ